MDSISSSSSSFETRSHVRDEVLVLRVPICKGDTCTPLGKTICTPKTRFVKGKYVDAFIDGKAAMYLEVWLEICGE